MGFVVLQISGHFGGVYQSHYCASDGAFLFSFVYVMYLNIDSYLYGKQIRSKLGNNLYLWMIFICVHSNRLDLHGCRTMILKSYYSHYLEERIELWSKCCWFDPPVRHSLVHNNVCLLAYNITVDFICIDIVELWCSRSKRECQNETFLFTEGVDFSTFRLLVRRVIHCATNPIWWHTFYVNYMHISYNVF